MLESNILEATKEHIKQVYPESRRIEIITKKDPQQNIIASIRVHAKKEQLVATKKDKQLKKSLEKSYQAILRQIHKVKTKRERRRNSGRHLKHITTMPALCESA